MLYAIITALAQNDITITSTLGLVLTVLTYMTLCPIMPRFIISVRELYDRDLHRRWQGIDTGFGVLSQPVSSGNAAMSAIRFADVAPVQEGGQVVEGVVDDSEAIRLEMRDGPRLV
jgi:hypothetical protein